MITYNSTYVKKLSKDVGEVEKVFYEIPAAFTKDGKLYMHNNESSSYYTDGLNQPYTAKEFIRDSILENNRTSSAKQTSDFNLQQKRSRFGLLFLYCGFVFVFGFNFFAVNLNFANRNFICSFCYCFGFAKFLLIVAALNSSNN